MREELFVKYTLFWSTDILMGVDESNQAVRLGLSWANSFYREVPNENAKRSNSVKNNSVTRNINCFSMTESFNIFQFLNWANIIFIPKMTQYMAKTSFSLLLFLLSFQTTGPCAINVTIEARPYTSSSKIWLQHPKLSFQQVKKGKTFRYEIVRCQIALAPAYDQNFLYIQVLTKILYH